MNNVFRRVVAVASLAVLISSGAEAAAVRSGATIGIWAAFTRGSAVAYDATNHVYLIVGAGGQGGLRGRFASQTGAPIGTTFAIQTSANYSHFPRVLFSPDADGGLGGFLVTWHESDLAGGYTSVHGRMVSFNKSGPSGIDTTIAPDGSWWEVAGPAIAYSTTDKEFLVVWRRFAGYGIRAVRVGLNAAPKDVVFTVSRAQKYEDNPSVAYNPTTNQFLVAYAGYDGAGNFAFVDSRLVQSGTNTLLNAAGTRLTTTVASYITDTVYNPATNQYLVAWYNGAATLGRLVGADGAPVGNVIALSARWKANDALSVAFNRLSNTFFLVSHDPTSVEDGGVEMNTDGTPVDQGFRVTAAGGRGNFYPRLAASTDDPHWLVSTANAFSTVMAQLVTGTASATAPTNPGTPTTPTPTTPTAPPPASPAAAPLMNVDSPGNATSVSSAGFQVSGWAIDRGASSGSGVDVINVYAWPVAGGSPTFLGGATYGIARPDVGGFYGAAFSASGFSLSASGLAAGTYDIGVYAHSTVSGNFDVRLKRVTVTAPVSIARMWIDTPAQNQNTSQNLTVAGWAVDLASTTTSGVDAIHVYAYATGSTTPIFLGAVAPGNSRPDVGNAFGASRFGASGFRLDTTALTPGGYTLVVFAHSSVTGTFNNAQTVAVTVR